MRWSSWLGACVLWTCAQQPRGSEECRTASDCPAPRVVQVCLEAERHDLPATRDLCERAWNETGDEKAAVSGALYALRTHDDATLKRWVC